uniref:Vacuolar ATP synthase subunit h n=1 Tax=Solanum tuberosum TaxID=4113 RepID=M1ASA2_SOLTU
MTTENAELTTEEVLRRDIPWETYMTTKLITGTGLQLLRRYDKKAESYKAQLLDDDGPGYVRVFVTILRDIFKEETVEYVLALIDEMLTGLMSFIYTEETVEYVLALIDEMLTANPKRARLFHDESLADEDTYEPFLRQYSSTHF